MKSMVTIARPKEEVFAFFLALDENAVRVDPSATSVVKTPDGPTKAGTEFRFRQKNLGKIGETVTRFTNSVPTTESSSTRRRSAQCGRNVL
jgi:hypothetical protein